MLHILSTQVCVLLCVSTREAYVKYNMTLASTHFHFSNKQHSVYCTWERWICLNNLHENPYIYLNSYFFYYPPNDAYTHTYIKRIDDNAQKYVVWMKYYVHSTRIYFKLKIYFPPCQRIIDFSLTSTEQQTIRWPLTKRYRPELCLDSRLRIIPQLKSVFRTAI